MDKLKNERNYYYIFLFILTVIAFLIRIEVVRALLTVDHNILYPSSVTDMSTYHKLATEVAGGIYDRLYTYQPFYYAVFLALIFKIFSSDIFYVLFFQALLGAFTVFFAAQSAKRLWDRRAGLAAALLLTFSQILIFYTSYLLIVTLQAFLVTMLLYFSLIAYQKKGFFYWSIAGFVLGCSILTRGNMWFMLPGLFLIVFIRGIVQNKGIIKRMLPALVFIAFVIIPQIPFIYENSIRAGALTGPSTAAGDVLLFGNTPESPPGGNEVQYGAGIIKQTVTGKYWNSTADKVPIVKRVWNYLRTEPLSYLELTFRKLLLFWDMKEIPNNVDINKNISLCGMLRYCGFIPTFLILILGGTGFLFFIPSVFKRKSELIIPLYIFGAYWIGICLFYMLARFRAPILPVLAVYGGGVASYMFSYANKKGRSIAVALLLLTGFSVITFRGYDLYRYMFEKNVMTYVRPEGTSVNLGNKIMVLDNGPMIYGSWSTILLNSGTVISKKIIVPNISSDLTFEMPIVFTKPGSIVIEINGIEHNVVSDNPGSVDFVCKVKNTTSTDIADSEKKEIIFLMKIIDSSGGTFAIIDYQRDYKRTSINDKPIDAELVCKAFTDLQ